MCKTLVIANMFLTCLSNPNGEATHMAKFPHEPQRKPVMVSIEGRPTSVGKNAPPGQKVGHLKPKTTGRKQRKSGGKSNG